jgi:hypothetical protein
MSGAGLQPNENRPGIFFEQRPPEIFAARLKTMVAEHGARLCPVSAVARNYCARDRPNEQSMRTLISGIC